MKFRYLAAAACAAPFAFAHPASAETPKKFGDPVTVGEGLTLDPILDARLRWEHVETPNVPATEDADAVTFRVRSGIELKHAPSHLAFLAESEATLGISNKYNAFPYVIADSQRRPGFDVVPDPQNIELNRLQVQYKTKAVTLTVGRQRINLDDQRWVGAVGWRQNEQTFDAVRGEATIGPVMLDATYAISQRTIFGSEAGPRTAFDGDFAFLGAATKLGPVTVKAFAYLLDYDAKEQVGALAVSMADTQTYGVRAVSSLPLGKAKLNLVASYARQSNWKQNPVSYDADYINAEAGLAYKGFTLTGGYELLGSDNGRAVQTPLATLHKFDGWADVFLVTPNAGLEDVYVSLGKAFPKVKALPGLTAQVGYHAFRSDAGSVKYGNEWNASIGFKLGKVALLAKFADYNAKGFGSDKRIVWLQAEYGF
jgi:hypothetical protein